MKILHFVGSFLIHASLKHASQASPVRLCDAQASADICDRLRQNLAQTSTHTVRQFSLDLGRLYRNVVSELKPFQQPPTKHVFCVFLVTAEGPAHNHESIGSVWPAVWQRSHRFDSSKAGDIREPRQRAALHRRVNAVSPAALSRWDYPHYKPGHFRDKGQHRLHPLRVHGGAHVKRPRTTL